MKKLSVRIVSLLLVTIMTLSTLASCGGGIFNGDNYTITYYMSNNEW